MGDNGSRRQPLVTYLLLVSTVLIQLYLSVVPETEVSRVFEGFALFPARLLEGVGVDSLVTYMFLHGNWVHFFVNAIALWGAGGIVEREIGSWRYGLVFLSSGVAGGLAHSLLHPSSMVPLVGASGGIFGVIAVLFLLMPFKITLALIVPLPSVLVGLVLSIAELSAVRFMSDVGTAHDTHIAGFVLGCLWAFATDRKRAVRGLIIAAAVLALLYFLGVFLELI